MEIDAFLNLNELGKIRDTGEAVMGQRCKTAIYDVLVEQSVVPVPDHEYLFLLKDISAEEESMKAMAKMRQETIDTAQQVIDKQMRVAQEIASLLGETTGETSCRSAEVEGFSRAGGCAMSFFIETSWGSLLKWGEELCGDRVELVKQEDGVLLVLSDGVGLRRKGKYFAGLTSKIITSMVTAGAELKDVVDTIASTLPVCKVREVAYSTFTMMQVDHEGNAYLVEFDNPTVILLRNGKRVFIPWVEQNISGKQIREAHLKLKLGDIAVTFSDGIIHAGVGRLLNLGWQHENVVQFLEETWQADDTAYDVQHRLLNECNSLYQGHPGDDTTVAALRICVPNPCCVMVGPPVHPEDDEEVVGELLACPGIKVICGGTTSQIVSKRLGRN